MKDADSIHDNMLPNKMVVNLDVFGALVLNQVRGHVDGAVVVTIHQGSLVGWEVDLAYKLVQP